MKITKYKRYLIKVVGISHYIYRPGQSISISSPGYAVSMAEAKRWINRDILQFRQDLENMTSR